MSKNNRVSVTVTCGVGSERHNHNVEYRQKLDHIKNEEQAQVLELIDYSSYKEQINKMMKPYIDEYNEKQKQRYNEAWQRFNNGEIKTKPRKSNYKPIDYDYFETHKNDTFFNKKTHKNEPMPMFRSIIIGLGDRDDKINQIITKEQAEKVFRGVVDKWEKLFPNLKLLGATMHFESGFWHLHIDYKPLCEIDQTKTKQEQGLSVSVSQEKAFESMGLEPEQSIINERDKAPIRFNAFRNKLYYAIENELIKNDLRLMYNATSTKNPQKDSSKNVDLNSWQEHRDAVDRLQELKNNVYDVFNEKDNPTLDGLNAFVKTEEEIQKTLKTIENQPHSRLNKDNVVVNFKLFDQMKSFLNNLLESIAIFSKRLNDLEEELKKLEASKREVELRNFDQGKKIGALEREAYENEQRRQFMENIKNNQGVSAEELFQKQKNDKNDPHTQNLDLGTDH